MFLFQKIYFLSVQKVLCNDGARYCKPRTLAIYAYTIVNTKIRVGLSV